MQKKLIGAALAVLVSMLAPTASAIEAGGVRFDDKITLSGADLVANGAGVRTKFVFDVYAITLYLPIKASTLEGITSNPGAKRIAIQLMRDVSAKDFVEALKSGMQSNLTEAEFNALKPQTQEFADTLTAAGEVKKGSTVAIDYAAGSGTRLVIGGKPAGKDIAGDAFYNALLKIWLGNKPVQSDLKAQLLGK